jgi:DNA-binding transcriptional LysR family regulator
MKLEYLREFIALSKTQNLTETAKNLHITQPAISNHMKALEKEIGVALFIRNDAMQSKASKMTQAGKSFLENAEKIVDSYDRAKLEARTVAKESGSKLAFRLPRTEMAQTVFSLLYEFKEEYPSIHVELCSWAQVDLIQELGKGEIDCGCFCSLICEKEFYDEEYNIDVFPFELLELFCVTSKDSPLNKKEALSIRDLSETVILLPANQKSTASKYALDNIFGKHGISPSYKSIYCDSIEDYISTRIGPDEAFLLDSLWAQWAPLKARKDCVIRALEPKVAVRYCFANRHDNQNEALALFKLFVRRNYLEGISVEP